MAETEYTVDVPEQRNWVVPKYLDPRLTPQERARYYEPGGLGSMTAAGYWNPRARGMGGTLTTCAEENVLGLLQTRYWGTNICVHEFSHGIMGAGIGNADPKWFQAIVDSYKHAKAACLRTANGYAGNTFNEYWAGGVEWYVGNGGRDRAGLKAVDPTLYELVSRLIPENKVAAGARQCRQPYARRDGAVRPRAAIQNGGRASRQRQADGGAPRARRRDTTRRGTPPQPAPPPCVPQRRRHEHRTRMRSASMRTAGRSHAKRRVSSVVALVDCVVAAYALGAQGTLDDYRRAAAINQRLAGLTVDIAQTPTWIGPTRFWYRKSVKGGNQFVMVDAPTGEKRAPFDHARLATALTSAAAPRAPYTATTLPFTEFTFVEQRRSRSSSTRTARAGVARSPTTLARALARRRRRTAADSAGGGGGARWRAGRAQPTPSTACVSPERARRMAVAVARRRRWRWRRRRREPRRGRLVHLARRPAWKRSSRTTTSRFVRRASRRRAAGGAADAVVAARRTRRRPSRCSASTARRATRIS